jgi:hypothetical protein
MELGEQESFLCQLRASEWQNSPFCGLFSLDIRPCKDEIPQAEACATSHFRIVCQSGEV